MKHFFIKFLIGWGMAAIAGAICGNTWQTMIAFIFGSLTLVLMNIYDDWMGI